MRFRVTACLGLLCLAGWAPAKDDTPSAQPSPRRIAIVDDGMRWWEHHPGMRQGNRLFRIEGMAARYHLALHVDQRKATNGIWRTTGSYVGMPSPSYGNWYHSGFLGIEVGGKGVQGEEPQVAIVEAGRQGVLDFVWGSSGVVARARFIAEPLSDHLLLEIRAEPQDARRSLAVGLNCYPQGYSVTPESKFRDEALERHMITAARDVQQQQKVTLDLGREWWQFYEDRTLEKTPIYERGGCALAFLPDEIQTGTVSVGSYTVTPFLMAKPGVSRLRLALWDFGGKPNARAFATLTNEVGVVRERMASASWLPTSIADFNRGEQDQRLDRLSKALGFFGSGPVKALRQRAAGLSAQCAAMATSQTVAAEAELCDALTQYRTCVWQTERRTRSHPRVLLLSGPFGYAWRVKPIAESAWGPGSADCGGYIWKYWIGHSVSFFPATMDELLTYDVVVLADIPQDPLTPEKRQMLADFVKRGGGLLVLGGPYAYGAAAWNGSPLESLLPVATNRVFDLQPATAPAPLALTSGGKKHLGRVRPPLGVVPWRNEALPRPGSEIWAMSGSAPFAVFGKAGEGRVVAILGAAVGEAPAGQTAFYDSPGWPAFLERLLVFLARGDS